MRLKQLTDNMLRKCKQMLGKNVPKYFCCVCQIWTDYNKKIGVHILEETLNKTMQKLPILA